MEKYIAFLRGINISGKNKLSMSELKTEFANAGFSQVTTYLNSGNVSFLSEVSDESTLKSRIENVILEKFELEIPVYIIKSDLLDEILLNAPAWWGLDDKEKYDNLIFILSNDSPEEICEMLGQPSEGLESAEIYKNVIFWTFDRLKYQKCNWWKKTASAGIAERITIRTANTVKKTC